ncbi:MAG: hypothetical protein M1817_006232 [Caeruleum heppii]|nr:MAG: hypothetical protein M1817_006232 [Caeruleum heppii]
MAFTYVNPKKEKWSTITLCPWFLSYAMKERWPSCDAWNEKIKSLSAQILDRAVTRFAYTPIDLFSLFDKVIIHELTHTRSGGGARDVNMNGLTDGKKAYGFKKCRDISGRESREGEFIPETVPHNNADTFAIFASGVRLINAGGTIDDRGRITRPANQKRWPSMAVPFDS